MSDVVLSSAGIRFMSVVEKSVRTGRLFEWVASLMMIAIGVTLSLWPKSAEAGSLRILVEAGFAAPWLIVGFVGGGAARLIALYANGHWPLIGPWLRAVGALGGAVLWSLMGAAVLPALGQVGSGALAVPVFFALCIGDVISCHRSLAHGRWQ